MNRKPAPHDRVLVIGTTSDYISHISRHFPGRALFVTDPRERAGSKEPAPPPLEELIIPMEPPELVLEAILSHLTHYNMRAAGVVCFDDESMQLSALIAARLGLSYPTPEAVLRCRCKLRSKQLWHQAGLDCPVCEELHRAEDATGFCRRYGPTVLKPLTGAGGELVFICQTPKECEEAWQTMQRSLAGMTDNRLYAPYNLDGRQVDPRSVAVAEQFRSGDEYSGDVLLADQRLTIIRITRKFKHPSLPGSAVLAYQLLAEPPVDLRHLQQTLLSAAAALGLAQGICMVDFLVDAGGIVLLELAPRPGGDCLPPLVQAACGLDMRGLALDHAAALPIDVPDGVHQPGLVGLHLFATPPGGVISHLDATELQNDQRVQEVRLTREIGHRVALPPEEYFSQMLGYALFMPDEGLPVQQQACDLLGKLTIRYAGNADGGQAVTEGANR